MTKLVFLDTETTGLNPDLHEPWEIAAIVRSGGRDQEYAWIVRPDLTHADPNALRISQFYERFYNWSGSDGTDCPVGVGNIMMSPDHEDYGDQVTAAQIAHTLAELLNQAVVVGVNPAFDRDMLRPWLRRHGQVWAAHYRTVDVTTLGWGQLTGGPQGYALHTMGIPASSQEVSLMLRVDPAKYERHTALGDARWARDQWDAIARASGLDPEAIEVAW
ncbi:3'-5' exonuclease [Marinitenerispora sediminis]|nr:3'-5' exonuclease [Marinitenerispora sediminis]